MELVEAPLDDAERAVTDGWRAQDVAALRSLEPMLAAVAPRHPLAQVANRLRAEWRIAARDPWSAREAMEIAVRAIWDRGRPGDMLLRARASLAADDPAAALDALSVLAARLDTSPRSLALARRGLRIARSIPPDPQLGAFLSHVESLLQARSAGQQPPPGR